MARGGQISVDSGKITYLDGVRGIAAVVVVIFHFILAGYPAITSGNPAVAHHAFESWLPYTPLYLFYSGSFSVAIFFVMSGFVLSYPFFKKKSREVPISGAFRRYFRLAIPVLLTSSLYFILMKADLLSPRILDGVSRFSYSDWLHRIYHFQPSFASLVQQSLFSVFFTNHYQYNLVLWTMRIEFFGSLLVFGYLLLFGKSKFRWLGYFALLFLVDAPQYQAFILGMALCDLAYHGYLEKINIRWVKWSFLLLGLYCAAFPHYMQPGLVGQTSYAWTKGLFWLSDGYKPWFIMILGATLLLIVVLTSNTLKRILNHSIFQYLGRISFSLYLTHFAVLSSFTAALFLTLLQYLPYNTSALLSLLISFPIMMGVATLTYHWVDRPSLSFASALYKNWCRPKIRPFLHYIEHGLRKRPLLHRLMKRREISH